LILQDGRSRTLLGVIHIPGLERNMISVSKMSDAGMHALFQKDLCKMVRGAMVLMKGVQIGTLYKLLGSVDSTGYNKIIVPKVDSTGYNKIVVPEVDSTGYNKIVVPEVDSNSTRLE
jgi:hypothetical protein